MSCQRGAHKHQRSPGFRPRKPISGIGVERSLPRDLVRAKSAMGLGIVIGTQFPSDKAKYGGPGFSLARADSALKPLRLPPIVR